MKKYNWHNWFWGLFFLVCAGVLVTAQLGMLTINISFWPLVWGLILVAAFLKSLASFSFVGMAFSLSFLGILFAKPLGIERLVPWTLLGAAALISIGLELIFRPAKAKREHHGTLVVNDTSYSLGDWHKANKEIKQTYQEDDSPTNFEVSVRMGSAVRYVNTTDFCHARIRVNMGEAKVYFDKAQITTEPATIELLGQIGDVDLYIPKEWNLQPKLPTFAVDYSEKGETPVPSGPEVLLTGNFHVGDVTVHYI